jgi:hypothetical protein
MPTGSHIATPIETRKLIEIMVVDSHPADARLTLEAFQEAGLTSGLRIVVASGSDNADDVRAVCVDRQLLYS